MSGSNQAQRSISTRSAACMWIYDATKAELAAVVEMMAQLRPDLLEAALECGELTPEGLSVGFGKLAHQQGGPDAEGAGLFICGK